MKVTTLGAYVLTMSLLFDHLHTAESHLASVQMEGRQAQQQA